MDGDSPILTEGRCSIGSIPKCRRESHCWRCAAMWAPSMQKVKGVSRMQPQVAEATNMEMLKPKSCWFKQQNVCFNMSNQHFNKPNLKFHQPNLGNRSRKHSDWSKKHQKTCNERNIFWVFPSPQCQISPLPAQRLDPMLGGMDFISLWAEVKACAITSWV